MILADKIINLRKKAGWSQEELASEMGVSRQSVSKWEGAQTIPEMDKILLLGEIFGVSTDYLLKDELGDESVESIYVETSTSNLRKVSLEDANHYIKTTHKVAPLLSLGVALCITAPVALILLSSIEETIASNWNEGTFSTIGIIILLLQVAIAIGLFMISSAQTKDFEYLKKEDFDTLYGVEGMINELKKNSQMRYYMHIFIGIFIIILSVSTILLGKSALSVAIMLVIVAIGVSIIVNAATRWSILEQISKSGEYKTSVKKANRIIEFIASIYWPLIALVYLASSFFTGRWEWTWVIWPLAGIMFGIIAGGISTYNDR